MTVVELINQAPWREAVTFRESAPHEYVMLLKDDAQELFEAMYEKFRLKEYVTTYFYKREFQCVFIGDYKYWFMEYHNHRKQSLAAEVYDLAKTADYALNRALLYRNSADFQFWGHKNALSNQSQ